MKGIRTMKISEYRLSPKLRFAFVRRDYVKSLFSFHLASNWEEWGRFFWFDLNIFCWSICLFEEEK